MKISLNLVKQFLDFELPAIDELTARIGAQLGEIESVEYIGDKYKGVVVAKVVKCIKHPNADKLSVCTIDDGGITPGVNRVGDGHVQVVCGAPNVREGLTVAWLPPGSTVPDSVGKEPFVLEARELRGVTSNGMLASPKELALGDSHDGILEIDKDAKPGQLFAEVYGLDDYIIDIENKMFTHRPDCFGILGVAREIAGILGHKFTSPDWYQTAQLDVLEKGQELPLRLQNELPGLVPRLMAVALGDIELKPSPVEMQTYLIRLGVRPISNVVDITNYVMLLTGQPLHAYDYDKVKKLSGEGGATLAARNPRESERLKLLNGKTINPRQQAIMIATDKTLIGLGGVMGGADTEVDEHTKNIILEAATFDMYSIRRTSMTHGLFTDAVTRYNKGQSPLQDDRAMGQALRLLGEHASAKQASPILDDNHAEGREWVHPPVPVTAEFINARLGLSLSVDDMKVLLENVEFKVEVDGDKLTVTAPFWRTDIESREDVIEEVGRLYGYDKLPLVLPRRSIQPPQRNDLLQIKDNIRHLLSTAGANELLTYSFVHGELIDQAGQDRDRAFQLSNALSPDLQYYRLSLLPSLLDKVYTNVKAGYHELALFEMGKAHDRHSIDEQGVPYELENLAFVFSAKSPGKTGAAFYRARKFLVELAKGLGHEIELVPLSQHATAVDVPFQLDRSAIIRFVGQEQGFGVLGEFKPQVRKNFKLPEHSAGFELGIGAFLDHLGQREGYVSLPRFPKVTQDMTLKVAADLPYGRLQEVVWSKLNQAKPGQAWLKLRCSGIYKSLDDAGHKNVTFRLQIASYERTLTDQEVAKLLDESAAAAADALGAKRV